MKKSEYSNLAEQLARKVKVEKVDGIDIIIKGIPDVNKESVLD